MNGKVYFAMKANSALGILALIGKLGGGMDIVSAGELARAIAAGIKPSDVVFSGVGKTNDEIRQALACHIGQINAESPAEVAAISAIAQEMNLLAPVALRVNVDVSPSTHAKISTGERNTKFGVSTKQSEARDIYQQMAEDPHISPAGLAVHIGSQICDLGPFERAYSALLALAIELRDAGLPVPNLDLGAESVLIMIPQVQPILRNTACLFSGYLQVRVLALGLSLVAQSLPIMVRLSRELFTSSKAEKAVYHC